MNRQRSLRSVVLALTIATAATACGRDQAEGSAQGSISTAVTEIESTAATGLVDPIEPQPGAVEEREEILRLASLETLDGDTFDPDSVAGVDVLLWFWGPH